MSASFDLSTRAPLRNPGAQGLAIPFVSARQRAFRPYANMDIRSKELNSENVLGILDTGFARQMEATFFDDLQKSREIRLEEWRRRSWLEKAKERVAVLFAEQY